MTPGHTLVVPKSHYPTLADLPDGVACELMPAARMLAAGLRRSGLRCEGVNLFYADGATASQEVFHAHLHVFPRFARDGFSIEARWGTRPTREHLDEVAARIRAALEHPA